MDALVAQLHKRGQQLYLQGLKFPVYVSWYYFKRHDGKYEKRFVISTKALKASTISWWGTPLMVSQRGGRVPRHKATGEPEGQIEGWFKTAKHRFGLHRFGQGTLLGVYRWFVLSLISYVLAHWAQLQTAMPAASCANAPIDLPDWGEAAEIASPYSISPFGSVTSFTRY